MPLNFCTVTAANCAECDQKLHRSASRLRDSVHTLNPVRRLHLDSVQVFIKGLMVNTAGVVVNWYGHALCKTYYLLKKETTRCSITVFSWLLFWPPACLIVFPSIKYSTQLLFQIRPRGESLPVIFSLKCNELPPIFPSAVFCTNIQIWHQESHAAPAVGAECLPSPYVNASWKVFVIFFLQPPPAGSVEPRVYHVWVLQGWERVAFLISSDCFGSESH